MFVVFEGIDGSGKTTISNRVATKLRESGLTVEHLREGGKFSSPVTQAIREFGRDARNLDLTAHAEFFLYVTRDVQLLDEMTRPALGRAEVVIADRFLYSAEVLSRFGRGLPESYVRPILDAAARGLVPDLVVLIDIDPHIARARRRVSKILAPDTRSPSRKGLSGVGMQQRFRAGYRELAAREPGRWVVIDNDQDLDATVERVFALLRDSAKSGAPATIEQMRRDEITSPHRTGSQLSDPQQALRAFLDLVDKRALREPAVAAYLCSGLFGTGIDERRRALADKAPEVSAAGLAGLVDPVSWALRDSLMAKVPGYVARSLSGVARMHLRATAMRAALVGIVPLDVATSLDTAQSDEAWTYRDQLFSAAPDAVMASLSTIDSPRAWAMRKLWQDSKGDHLASYANARNACKSITGLDDDRAWELRKLARENAPISAVASLFGLTSDKSWKWRERYLDRVPKTVFETIAGSDDPRAWDYREKMVAQCKEAVDSIDGLDGNRAWRLREQYADLWPSTVIKSLGPMAATDRGRKLIERQLHRYPENVSLLKHAAAIALGAHLDPEVALD